MCSNMNIKTGLVGVFFLTGWIRTFERTDVFVDGLDVVFHVALCAKGFVALRTDE